MSCEPNKLIPVSASAGLNFQSSVALPDYPANTWAATLYLRGPSSIDLTSVGSGSVFTFTVSSGDTSKWLPGGYWYSLRVSDGNSVIEIETGKIEIKPDLVAATSPFDGRTELQKSLDAIDAVLAGRATLDQERYKINNRELWRTPIADLLKLRSYYATRVRRETAQKSGRGKFGRQIPVRFS